MSDDDVLHSRMLPFCV
uniref:Uncharacterized protein n=1 Tax=Arundo donax TaxID=35708 RepID=A0A0A9ES24_ARUDO